MSVSKGFTRVLRGFASATDVEGASAYMAEETLLNSFFGGFFLRFMVTVEEKECAGLVSQQ